MRNRLIVLAILMPAAGCGPSAKELFQRDRPAVEERIRLIDEYAQTIEAGKASKEELKLPEGLKLEISDGTIPTNTLTLQWDSIIQRRLDEESKLNVVFGGGTALFNMRRSLNDMTSDLTDAHQNMTYLLTPRYLCVVHLEKLTLPTANMDAQKFIPGRVEFRIYVFDMAEKKELGSIPGKAENDAEIEVRDNYSANKQLTSNLAGNAAREFTKVMKPYSWR